jgi:hypothetical protein
LRYFVENLRQVCVPKQAKPAASSSPGGSGIRPGGSGEAPKPPEQGIVKVCILKISFVAFLQNRTFYGISFGIVTFA